MQAPAGASIWPLAFAAMNDAGAAAFGAWPHVESVSDVAATAIVTDHAWPQNLDSVDACEPITLESASPQRTLRSAPWENQRGASDGTVTTLRPPLGDAHINAAAMPGRDGPTFTRVERGGRGADSTNTREGSAKTQRMLGASAMLT
jgi:hypothetical protein